MRRCLLTIALGLPVLMCADKAPKQAEVKIQRTSFSREQEIQLGKEAAAQVEREQELVRNAEIEGWLNKIGQSLAKTPQANAYPYYFRVVNNDTINAFALPGGPMYVHTGLLRAADTEGEVAGVLAHEMSHVALRHGAAQVSKQQMYGLLFGIAGAAAGVLTSDKSGQCGILCQITQAGTSLGQNSLLMKFSRGYEHDADLNGARMMAAAGYDPLDLPKFFEKLEAKAGKAGEPKGLALWLSSHPATGKRIQYVSEDIKFYPQRTYTAQTGGFAHIKQVAAAIPPPKPQPGMLLARKEGARQRTDMPGGYSAYDANGFSIAYPSAWQVGQPQPGGSLYMIPKGGAVGKQDGGVELLSGAMIDYYVPRGAGSVNLDSSTSEFVGALKKGDANLAADRSERAEVGGKAALLTKLRTKTSLQQEPEQAIDLYTVAQEGGLWFIALAKQPSQQGELDAVFKQMMGSVAFITQKY